MPFAYIKIKCDQKVLKIFPKISGTFTKQDYHPSSIAKKVFESRRNRTWDHVVDYEWSVLITRPRRLLPVLEVCRDFLPKMARLTYTNLKIDGETVKHIFFPSWLGVSLIKSGSAQCKKSGHLRNNILSLLVKHIFKVFGIIQQQCINLFHSKELSTLDS